MNEPAEYQIIMFDAIQDALLDFRDNRVSVFNAPNGLVAREKDGTPSEIIRMRIPDMLRLAEKALNKNGYKIVKIEA